MINSWQDLSKTKLLNRCNQDTMFEDMVAKNEKLGGLKLPLDGLSKVVVKALSKMLSSSNMG
jgi:hypothetical protein